MRTRIKPDFSKISAHSNPFVNENFKIITNTMSQGIGRDGKVIEHELEAEKYAKVFTASDHRKSICKLSPPAQRLLLWIICELDQATDYVWINRIRYMTESDVKSVNTLRTAVKELVAKQFITPTILLNTYWINPALMFCGSRPNKYPNKVTNKPKN